jgi:hypothetical protein
VLGPFDLARYAPAIAPAAEFIDHRRLGFPSGRGADELLRSIGSLLEQTDEVVTRVDDVLALRPDAFLVRWTTSGVDRNSRGPFEWQFLRLCVFADDGLLVRAEQFDVDRADDALARFDALAGALVAPQTASVRAARLANAACRNFASFSERWRARDWQGVVDTCVPAPRLVDRRALTGWSLAGDDVFANLRVIFDMGPGRIDGELLATRGDRLALFRLRLAVESDPAGLSDTEYLCLLETDESGRSRLYALFDTGDVGVAYDELDERYAAGGDSSGRRAALTRAFCRAFAARDWDALGALLAPDLVVTDHRVLGWETSRGPSAYIDAVRSLVDLAPDVQLRVDHLTMAGARFLYVTTWHGTREGGAFESPSVMACELDEEGRIRRFDQYDIGRLDELRARFEEVPDS